MQKSLLLGGILGAAAAVSLGVALGILVLQSRGEAGAEFLFLLVLGSPLIAGGGAAVGIVISMFVQGRWSRVNVEGRDEWGPESSGPQTARTR
jgi:hypothetical protein